jgi:prolyl-tRNA synthetase
MGKTMLLPRTETPPAKVGDPGIINLVKAGEAAYNAKSAELLLLPAGCVKADSIISLLIKRLTEDADLQHVDCGSDAGMLSIAERFVGVWGAAALSFCERRGRDIRLLGWSEDLETAWEKAGKAESAMINGLAELGSGAGMSFSEEIGHDGITTHSLLSLSTPGSMGTRGGFLCSGCGKFFLPDSPMKFCAIQPGAGEIEENLADIETPGANTIADLCEQLGAEKERTIKAMLYIAFDGAHPRPIASFVRGDYSVSMNKLAKWLKAERGLSGLRPAEKSELRELIGEVAGYCGPVGLPENVVSVCDESVCGARNTIAGANRQGYHRTGCCHGRDFDLPIADIALAVSGIHCSCGGGTLAPAALRELGTIETELDQPAKGKPRKTPVCRDRYGVREYPAEWRGTFSIEKTLLSISENCMDASTQ